MLDKHSATSVFLFVWQVYINSKTSFKVLARSRADRDQDTCRQSISVLGHQRSREDQEGVFGLIQMRSSCSPAGTGHPGSSRHPSLPAQCPPASALPRTFCNAVSSSGFRWACWKPGSAAAEPSPPGRDVSRCPQGPRSSHGPERILSKSMYEAKLSHHDW